MLKDIPVNAIVIDGTFFSHFIHSFAETTSSTVDVGFNFLAFHTILNLPPHLALPASILHLFSSTFSSSDYVSSNYIIVSKNWTSKYGKEAAVANLKLKKISFKGADLQDKIYFLIPRTQNRRSNHSTATFGTKFLRNRGSVVFGNTLLSIQTETPLFHWCLRHKLFTDNRFGRFSGWFII
jgi:hypothetical protein